MRRLSLLCVCVMAAASLAASGRASPAPLGIFQGHADIGAPQLAGGASYDPIKGDYIVTASGENVFNTHDEFHFVWRSLTGNFVVQARIAFLGPGVAPHRKAGLMARADLGADSAYVDGVIHGQGPVAMQVRATDGATTAMLMASPVAGTDPRGNVAEGTRLVRLERRGDSSIYTEITNGKPPMQHEIDGLKLPATLYVGLFLCAHDPNGIETARFDDVTLRTGDE